MADRNRNITTDGRLKKYTARDINYHPLVKITLTEVARSAMSDADIAARAGVGSHYFVEMRRGKIPNPRVVELEAVLNVLGREIKIV